MKLSSMLTLLAAGLLLLHFGLGLAQQMPPDKVPKINCAECHTCEKPTTDSPCLLACPRLFAVQTLSKHDAREAPDTMLLNRLVDQYGPVRFNHRLHASMADMGAGCQSCHHFSRTDRVPACSECHGGEANPNNLRQPSLKGAYHRQCLSCHREWSHDTRCVVCHLPGEKTRLAGDLPDSTDFLGVIHPLVSEPVKQVYFTRYEVAPMVTFYHKQHIDLFGLRCVDCHQKENCGNCHDLEKTVKPARSQEEVHAVCSSCHGQDRCSKCHDTRERPAFSHGSTGWALNRFHQKLDCRECHPPGKRIARLNRECTTCHGGWSPENFQHAVTGLQLDETHSQFDCTECHAEKNYGARPICSACHDDNPDHRAKPPGKLVKVGSGKS